MARDVYPASGDVVYGTAAGAETRNWAIIGNEQRRIVY
jgi:hypothetical protein